MEKSKSNWQKVIGLEIHVQVNSKSKAFCGDKNEFINEPNIHISPITLAHPGTLPRVNEYQIRSAVKLGLAFGSKINSTSYFDRKNYFYPDLPKGYQITQDVQPICVAGSFDFPLPGGREKTIRIHHLHMEEDAGKSIHDQDLTLTFLDFNRAGVPLIEIVTEPDFRSSEEVFYFIQYLQMLVRNLNISDGNMEEGSFRCDCNVSVMPKESKVYGTRCEIKNLNSKRFARQAIDYEADRQIKSLESGNTITQTTLLYDPVKGITYPMRDKEEVNDYRYFNDPDLPPVIITKELLEEIKTEVTPTPMENFRYLKKHYKLTEAEMEVLVENERNMSLLHLFEKQDLDRRESALLIINKLIPEWEKYGFSNISQQKIVDKMSNLIKLYLENKVSKTIAYQNLFDLVWENRNEDVEKLAIHHKLILSQDSDALNELVIEIIEANPEKVNAYQKGKKGLIGFFMGEGMKKSRGKYDPKTLNKAFQNKLSK